MHSLPSQTALGHYSLFKTFPTYAFLWNIYLYHDYVFLFCPFSCKDFVLFGPYFGLLVLFSLYFVIFSTFNRPLAYLYIPLTESLFDQLF